MIRFFVLCAAAFVSGCSETECTSAPCPPQECPDGGDLCDRPDFVEIYDQADLDAFIDGPKLARYEMIAITENGAPIQLARLGTVEVETATLSLESLGDFPASGAFDGLAVTNALMISGTGFESLEFPRIREIHSIDLDDNLELAHLGLPAAINIGDAVFSNSPELCSLDLGTASNVDFCDVPQLQISICTSGKLELTSGCTP